MPEIIIPAHSIPIDNDDRLTIRAWTLLGQALNLRWMVQLPETGEIQFNLQQIVTTENYALSTFYVTPGVGRLIHVSITPTETVQNLSDYVTVSLGKVETASPVPYATLISNYLGNSSEVTWPGHPLTQSIDEVGLTFGGSGVSPAAGANYSLAFEATQQIIMESIQFRLVTNATAADRRVTLTYAVAGTNQFTKVVNVTQAASLTYNYHFALGLGEDTLIGTDVIGTLPNKRWLPTFTFGIAVTNIQATDQISLIRQHWRHWIYK